MYNTCNNGKLDENEKQNSYKSSEHVEDLDFIIH